jgi:GntR family transcriptional repressor for pyruvate dehydrogenase complex
VTEPQFYFRPIVGARAHEEVIDQIIFAIRSGAYRVGERLPSLDELSHQLHVSKPTVGEALRALSIDGVVETRRGVNGGATVTSDNIPRTLMAVASGNRDAGLRELVEARRPIEMEIARLAGKRATEQDFSNMQVSIDRLSAYADGAHAGLGDERETSLRLHYDYLFHYAMGRAARNDLLAYYQHQILERLVVAMHDYLTREEDLGTVIDLHVRTLAALKRGGDRRINTVMDEHLRLFEDAVERVVPRDSRAELTPSGPASGKPRNTR